MRTMAYVKVCATLFVLTAVAWGVEGDSASGIISPVQATARPMGLSIVGPVMLAGSDAAAAKFQKEFLPSISQLLNVQLAECKKINDSSYLLDPSRLQLNTESDVRVYFIGEGAGYRNTVGFSVTETAAGKADQKLIFPDASSSVSTYDPAKNAVRSANMPLLPGDFVNLGTVDAKSMLDFFLISNGVNGGKSVFSTMAANNPDHLNHVVSFAMANSPYLILSFEDMLGGGDRDFNDVLIAVDIGQRNVAALTGAPEPAMLVVLGSFLLFALGRRGRNSIPGGTANA